MILSDYEHNFQETFANMPGIKFEKLLSGKNLYNYQSFMLLVVLNDEHLNFNDTCQTNNAVAATHVLTQ